jgi:hypothetical protein
MCPALLKLSLAHFSGGEAGAGIGVAEYLRGMVMPVWWPSRKMCTLDPSD